MSINNKVMGILIHREARSTLAFGCNERAGYAAAFFRLRIGLFQGADDEGSDGGTGTLGAVAEPVVERFRNIDGGSDWHDMIMS
jgi:hypothetical protein